MTRALLWEDRRARADRRAVRSQPPRPVTDLFAALPSVALRTAEDVLAGQALAGNRAVSRLLAASPPVEAADHPFEKRAEQAERDPRGAGLAGARAVTRRPSPLASGAGATLTADAVREIGLRPASLSAVRLHTGQQADELNDALGAEGFSHGTDVFLSSRYYQPNTAAGAGLLAHELSHATGPSAATGRLHLKRQKVYLDFIRFKRLETHIGRKLLGMALRAVGAKQLAEKVDPKTLDHYGHWWAEAGTLRDTADPSSWQPARSYGWWPVHGVSLLETLKIKRVEGVLNSGERDDPHHGQTAGVEFHPVMEVDDTEAYESVRDRVMKRVEEFAHGFKGSWNWRLGWGKNCHTFQERMMKSVGLLRETATGWLHGAGIKREEEPKPETVVKPKTFEDIKRLLRLRGVAGMGLGGLTNLRAACRGMVTYDEIAGLSAEQRHQLLLEVNEGQEDWNHAAAKDINDFFYDVTGEPVSLWK